ncbi:MAG: LysM peptidoglycan-binding domain-containing protein [Candidatus Doudnabacteria bacterium]|nr:LysM peptidoglycan-binding domain-containing protein [Candidatus Doudnabacteria bacterium]
MDQARVLHAVRRAAMSVAVFAIVGSALVPLSARAVEYGGVGGRPANPRSGNPRTESIFIHTLNPGESVTDGVKVLNNTPEQKTLLVYAVDSAVSSGGAFACTQAVDEKKDVGRWIVLSKTEVVLPSLAYEVVPFKLSAPLTASVGEHNGCIIIQEKKAQASGGQQQGGIQLSFRTGLRVAVLVPGAISRKLAISGFSVERKPTGVFLLKPAVKNEGNVSVDANVQVTTSYFFGKELTRNGGEYPVLRGEESKWNLDLARPFWGGWYKSALSVSYDANPTAQIGSAANEQQVTLRGPAVWFWSTPAPAAIVIECSVLLVLLGLCVGIMRGLIVRRVVRKTWVTRPVRSGETLNDIARSFGISWKALARANKLRAPYALKVGQKIKVPPTE